MTVPRHYVSQVQLCQRPSCPLTGPPHSGPARLQGVHGAVGVSGSAVGEGRGADGLDARRLRAAGTRVHRTADGQGPITPWNIVSATVLKQLSNIHNKCT